MRVAQTDLARRLNRDCFCIGTDVPVLQRWLEQDLKQRGLAEPIVATHPHLFSALPVFLARDHARQMQAIIRAIETVVALPAYQEAVLAQAPHSARHKPWARGVFLGYDFHLCAAGPQLIEINTNAGGAMLNAALSRAQRACCVEVEQYLRGQRGNSDFLEQGFLQMFLQEWRRARGDQRLTTIAIVDDAPAGQYLYPEFLLFQRLFETSGVSVLIADTAELHCENGALWSGDRRIDMVYNRLTDFYFQQDEHAALAQAYAEDLAVVTPHPHAHALYSSKRNLVLLTDETGLRAMQVDGETIDTLLHGIPATREISSRGDTHWWNERKQWFFKPTNGFGSRGSYRGDKLTRKVFCEIMQNTYVAQALALPSERRLIEGAEERLFKLDLRNYVYAGETQLIAARLYQGQTTNFRTPGGGFAPVYVLPREDDDSGCGCDR